MHDAKQKERRPEETVTLFRDRLAALGVCFEERFASAVDGACSLRLTDAAHGWQVNGKGTDRAYCMASAYGEAVERFQSHLAYEAGAVLSDEAVAYLGFSQWPDEQMRPLQAFHTCEALRSDFREACAEESEEEGLAFLSDYLGAEQMPFVPFYSVRKGGTVMLPDPVISLLAGSNGLAAGNTQAEALCQALSEVVERYAKYAIMRQGLTPPEIPQAFLETRVPELCALKQRIEEKSGYRLFVRDASMGRGLPAVSVLLVDQVRQRYYAKFGAHPCFEVALERCLTELLQGYTPGVPAQDALVLTCWDTAAQNWDTGRNLMDSYRSDIALLPDTCLAGVPSWAFVPWGEWTAYDNVQGTRALLRLLLSIAPDVYIRDTGFLGIPTFRVYVPGVSRLPVRLGKRNLRYHALHKTLEDIEGRAASLSLREQRELVDAFEAPDTAFGGRNDQLAASAPLRVVHALICYQLGEDARAAVALSGAQTPKERCLQRYITLGLGGTEGARREALLRVCFGEETAGRVIAALGNRERALSAYLDPLGLLSMLRQARAEADGTARRLRGERINRLHMRVKECMKSGMPSQRQIAEWVRR